MSPKFPMQFLDNLHGQFVGRHRCKHLICHLSIFIRFARYWYPHIYFSCIYHKQLNSDLKAIIFVMLAVHSGVALISSSQNETRLFGRGLCSHIKQKLSFLKIFGYCLYQSILNNYNVIMEQTPMYIMECLLCSKQCIDKSTRSLI